MLTEDVRAVVVDPAGGQHTYQTDRFGNVLAYTDPRGHTTLFERDFNGLVTLRTDPDPDGAGPLVSDGTYDYEYDAEGNRTRRTTIATGEYVEYEWDHRNRLTDVIFRTAAGVATLHVRYTYDAFNRLVRRQRDANGNGVFETAESFVYDGSDIVLVFNDPPGGSGSGSLTNRLLPDAATHAVFADEAALDEILWHLTDHQGTVRDVARRDATTGETEVVNHLTFSSFGAISSETDPSRTPIVGYTGMYRDPDTGLQKHGERWYDPETGQWLSEDPIGFAAGDSNLRRYVGNSPTNFIDPDGLTGVGHHPMPQAILRNVEEFAHLLTEDAYNVGYGYYTGETSPPHSVSKNPYVNREHPKYNEAVKQKFQEFLHRKGITRKNPLTAEQMKEFICELEGAHGNSTIGKFNREIAKQRERLIQEKKRKNPRYKPPKPAAECDLDELIERGKKYRKTLEYWANRRQFMRDKHLADLQEKMRDMIEGRNRTRNQLGGGGRRALGTASGMAAGAVGGAIGGLASAAESPYLDLAHQALLQGDIAAAERYLIGGGGDPDGLNSLYGQMLSDGQAQFALTFREYMSQLFAHNYNAPPTFGGR